MTNFKDKLSLLIEEHSKSKHIYRPLFYRLANADDRKQFIELLNTPGLSICDTIIDQVKEYVKLLSPAKKFTPDELTEAALNHIGKVTTDEYGVWVYYSWTNRLIHILDEEEYIRLRTSRNQNKITWAEQQELKKKKIGVIGLSVGQSVAVTLVMERICGEIRLADFDTLEVTNLNRIRTGIHNLGLHKVYSVAREISEIDPFFNVKCFPEGVTEDNIDAFFTEGGKLDLMVEESDGFDIKIISRYKARELGVPVIMEASDRCMVDVERFDLEPKRSILHGLVEHLDIAKLKSLKTTEEKIPYMLDILGLETSSVRLKASMIEIEQTINTWPQLASAVTMGGGITADISRRMLLNQYTESGRYHVDIEELIGNKNQAKSISKSNIEDFPELSVSQMEQAILHLGLNSKTDDGLKLNKALIKTLIEDAIKAPSAGNNQPWKWYATDDRIFLFHDKNKSAGWSDPFDDLAHIGLGAAIQNLKLSALHHGYIAEVIYQPSKGDQLLIAEILFKASEKTVPTLEESLFKAIPFRCTNRKKGDRKPIEKKIFDQLSMSAMPDGELIYTQDEKQITELAEIISAVEKERFLHPEGHKEFFIKELRWNEKEAEQTKDGLELATLELSFKDQVGLRVASDPEVIEKTRQWKGGAALQNLTKYAVLNSSAIALIRLQNGIIPAFIKGGEVIQRVWLAANNLGLEVQPVSAPLFFFKRIKVLNDLPEETNQILFDLEQRFLRIFPQDKTCTDFFLFRLYKGENPSKKSLRRNLEDSLVFRELKNVHI